MPDSRRDILLTALDVASVLLNGRIPAGALDERVGLVPVLLDGCALDIGDNDCGEVKYELDDHDGP